VDVQRDPDRLLSELLEAYHKLDPEGDILLFRRQYLDLFLRYYEPPLVAKYLLASKGDITSMMAKMRSIPRDIWERLVNSGYCFVRGRTRSGDPIFWWTPNKIPQELNVIDCVVPFFAWMTFHGIRMNRAPGVTNVTVSHININEMTSNLGTWLKASAFLVRM